MMDLGSILGGIIRSFAYQTPTLLMACVGLFFAAVNWSKAPRASLFCLLGFGLILLVGAIFPFINHIVPRVLIDNNIAGDSLPLIFGAMSFTWSLLNACAYGLLLAAVFVDRNDASAENPI